MVTPATEADERDQIVRLLNVLNDAWLLGRNDLLAECLDEDAVFRGPDMQELARGVENCIESYATFTREAAVRSFRMTISDLDLWGETAMAVCPWEIAYTRGGRMYSDAGRDLYLFHRGLAGWRLVWRVVLPGGSRRPEAG